MALLILFRIRKKQRYQELLDSEQKLQDLVRAEELTSQRVQSIKNFLSIREGMLQGNDSIRNTSGFSQDGSQENMMPDGQLETMKENCTMLKSAVGGSQDRKQGGERIEYTRLLGEVVEDVTSFRMDIDKHISPVSRSVSWHSCSLMQRGRGISHSSGY